jgi:hypothetical protein
VPQSLEEKLKEWAKIENIISEKRGNGNKNYKKFLTK